MLNMKVERITPSMAAEYLKNNTDNRKLRPWWATSLAGAIGRGEWILTHQGVAFDSTGKLIDGQHKLHAIIQAGSAVEVAVYRGISPEAFKVLDVGLKRTYSDITGLSQKTAEVCRAIAATILMGNNTPTADQLLDVANCGVADLHESLIEHCASNAAIVSSAPVRMAATVMMLNGHSQKYIKDLYGNLIHQNYNELPIIGQSFLKQANKKTITPNNKSDIIARAVKVFNPKCADIGKLTVSAQEMELSLSFLRKVVRKAMGVPNE